jgi:hypothetical protein
MIDLLLRSGADINVRSRHWAGGFGALDDDGGLADFLIARGARIDAHATARLGMFDKLRELVTADPTVIAARGGDGQTPLSTGTGGGHRSSRRGPRIHVTHPAESKKGLQNRPAE